MLHSGATAGDRPEHAPRRLGVPEAPESALAELRRRSEEFKRSLEGLTASYAIHLELLCAAVQAQGLAGPSSDGVWSAASDDCEPGPPPGKACAPSLEDADGADASDALSSQETSSWPTEVALGAEHWPGEAEVVGVDVRDFWRAKVVGPESSTVALPSCIDWKRHKARISGYEVLHTASSRYLQANVATSSCNACSPIMPESTTHKIWTTASLLFIVYDVLSLPLTMSFSLDDVLFFSYMNLAGSVFWTLDIGMSFVTGFYKADKVERGFPEIARHYIRGWFLLDLSVVVVDWTVLILVGQFGAGAFRLVKVPRWVRAIKVFKMFDQALDMLLAKAAGVIADNVRFFLYIVAFSHFIACGWHLVGDSQQGNRASWLDHGDLDGKGPLFLYFVSLQWSVSQFTPGKNPYDAQNLAEWVYTCVVLFFGMAVYSSFLGGITGSLTCVRTETMQRYRDEKRLIGYLRANNVGEQLRSRINAVRRYQHIGGKSPPVYSDIKGFQNFPQSLLTEIKWSTCSPCIRLHPLFSRFMASHAGGVYRICSSAVAELSCRWGHELFHVGALAEQMLFVKSGCLQYSTTRPVEEDLCVLHRSSRISSDGLYRSSVETVESMGKLLCLTSPSAQKQSVPDVPGATDDCILIRPVPDEEAKYPWICEAALWCVWTHHGTAVARENSVVLAVQSAALQAAVADDVPVREALRTYAQAFARHLGERAARCDWHNYIGVVNDYWGGDRSGALADLAVARADQELARISRQMRRGVPAAPPADPGD